MTSTRIYKTTTPAGSRLVRAANKAQAINHVARATMTAEVASQDDLLALVTQGVKVETAGEADAD